MQNFSTLGIKDNSEQAILEIIADRIDTLRKNRGLFICLIYETQFNDEIKDMLKSIFSKVFDDLICCIESEKIKVNNDQMNYMVQMILSTIVGVIIFESLTGSNESDDTYKLLEIIKTIIL